MKKPEQQAVSVESRRTFLKTVAAAGSGVAVLAASGTAAAGVEAPAVETANEKLGYHMSEHIRSYYDRADF